MTRTRLTIPLFTRRDLLRLGAASVGVAVVPGCETLTLPNADLEDAIDPITSNEAFYLQSCCGTPNIAVDSWTLSIKALGVQQATLNAALLATLPVTTVEHTLQCIGSSPAKPLISNAVWGGMPLLDVLDQLGVSVPGTAIEQKWTCADGYHTSLPVDDLAAQWLVWEMNGEPLSADHGAPARVLTPGRYGTKNPKWPEELDFVDVPWTGFWEASGWSSDAVYQTNGFILQPGRFLPVSDDTIRILGTAFAGLDPIVSVQVTTDGGDTWADAEIVYGPDHTDGGDHIWTLWRLDWSPPAPGIYTIQVRATAASGAESNPNPDGTDPFNGYNGGMALDVEVV